MGYTAAPLEKLIEQFSQFPGIGRKGATRMAYQVLSMSDADAAATGRGHPERHTRLHRCRVCQNYTEAELCPHLFQRQAGPLHHLRGRDAPRCAGL